MLAFCGHRWWRKPENPRGKPPTLDGRPLPCHMRTPGFDPGLQWWQASALTTALSRSTFWRVFNRYGHCSHLGHVTPPQHHVNKISLPCTWKLTYKIWLKMAQWFLRKAGFKFHIKGQSPEMTDYLECSHTFINSFGCLHLSQAAIVSEISTVFTFSYRLALSYQIWPCHKRGQGQPRVIIWTYYDGLSPRCYIPSFVEIGPPVLEKIFEGFLLYMGVVAILVMWPRCRKQAFVPPTQGGST